MQSNMRGSHMCETKDRYIHDPRAGREVVVGLTMYHEGSR